MSLKDRLRNKKAAQLAARASLCEYNISIQKISKAIEQIENPADLGNIVKEIAKFLNTLASDNAQITFSGNFDLGQKTLLNCILSKFTEDEVENVQTEDIIEEQISTANLIKKRKSVKEKLKAALQEEENDN